MKEITLENLKVIIKDTATNSINKTLDFYSFNCESLPANIVRMFDDKGSVKVDYTTAQDEDGNTFATKNDFISFLKNLCLETPNLGSGLRLDNIELINTGKGLKMINKSTSEETFMVQQRVDPVLGTTSVFVTEHTTELQVEDSSNAYQGLTTHTKTATLNAQGRYAMPIDIEVSLETFIHEYRSKLNTTIDNINIKIFSVTQSPDLLEDYNELSGIGIVPGWYISKRPYWSLNENNTIQAKAGQDIESGDSALPFSDGFSLKSGDYYRFVISADNEFEFQGVEGAPNPFGGTQFIPYIERSYTGEIEVKVKTEGATIHTTELDFYRDGTNTSIILSNGESFNVNTIKAVENNGTIKIISVDPDANLEFIKNINHELVSIANTLVGGSVANVVNQLNQLFAVQPLGLGGDYISTLPTLAGAGITANFAEGQDPVGDSIYGVATDTSQHGARVWSDETIDETGEYYEVKITGKGQFMLGLYSVDDGDLTEITNNSGTGHSGYKWANAFYNYGSYVAPWTTYGSNSGLSYGPGWNGSTTQQMRYNTTVQDNLANANPANPVLFKVGINAQGYVSVWYFDEGRSNEYILTARSTYTLPEGQYGLLVKLVNGTVQLVETPERTATDPTAPALTHMYVESNGFDYPLFASAEEANFYDSQNGGGGTSSVVIYPDDATNTQWHRPTNGFTQDAVSAPTDTIDITWNEIPTTTLTPDAYPDTTIEVNENATFNIPVAPADADFITSVNVSGNMWASLDVSGNLIGTAPEVTGDYNANPNDEYTFAVTRTSEGSSTGTLTIRVINLTAPITAISGFNHIAGTTAMVDSDTMGDGSVVHVNNTVADGERFVIQKSYVETNILPSLQASGDQYIIGLKNTASDFTTLEIADFDAAIVWEYETSNSHTFKFYRDGSVVQNIVINSMTDAYYDYAIEVDGTSAWLIACNVNSIMNEPSPNDGGSFSHTYEVTNIEDTAPVQIHMAALNTTGDISTTGIETLTTPSAPVSTTTPFTKAIDFSGGSEYLNQNSTNSYYNPIMMGGASATVAAPTAGQTVSNGHPWATAMCIQS